MQDNTLVYNTVMGIATWNRLQSPCYFVREKHLETGWMDLITLIMGRSTLYFYSAPHRLLLDTWTQVFSRCKTHLNSHAPFIILVVQRAWVHSLTIGHCSCKNSLVLSLEDGELPPQFASPQSLSLLCTQCLRDMSTLTGLQHPET